MASSGGQPGESDAVLVNQALAQVSEQCRRAQGSERLYRRMHERLRGLLQALNGAGNASQRALAVFDVVRTAEDFNKVILPSEDGMLALVAALLVVSKAYETHRRIGAVYTKLEWREDAELASAWRVNWNAARAQQEQRLTERIELSTDEMLERELDAPSKLKALKRMAFELKFRAGGASAAPPFVAVSASDEVLHLLDATVRRVEPGVGLLTDKRHRELEEGRKKMQGQLLAQMGNR